MRTRSLTSKRLRGHLKCDLVLIQGRRDILKLEGTGNDWDKKWVNCYYELISCRAPEDLIKVTKKK